MRSFVSLLLVCVLMPSQAAVVGWLGDGTAHHPDSAAPLTWDLAQGTNVKWRTDLGARSASGVIVVGDKLFTQVDPYFLVCLDAGSGKELWRRSYSMLDLLSDTERQPYDDILEQATGNYDGGKQYKGKELQALGKVGVKLDGRTGWIYATTFPRATPASNGRVVVARNQCGGFSCFNLDGKQLWSAHAVGMSSSPIIVGDTVIMAHRGLATGKPIDVKSAKTRELAAFDLKTGKKRWGCPTT